MQGQTSSPRPGPQPHVKYCPNCKGDLHPVGNKKPISESHAYKCDVCDWKFEINQLSRDRDEELVERS